MPTKMSRLAVYAGVSAALAGGVVVSAFHQRPNFYSACVYLAQSNLCLMILINLILLIYASLVYGLQRLCYGSLRPIEIEQLYEKGWFAVTETCLAMTIFREEVGAWFLVMFVALLTGKVWGWIGDGRVEVFEQQPPANPRLFHIRLSISLAMSIIYDLCLMRYTINKVYQLARPNMMVMFLFEFAVLSTSSLATASRYAISLTEARIVKKQTQDRLAERRREVREERAELIRQREAAIRDGNSSEENDTRLPSEDDVDEMDIEVPGWEAKGQWVLTLDLVTDFLKLLIYVSFFVILMVFYGLPIHIMRDLVMTLRSFIKRLTAFLRYRRATQDMNSKYEDATEADIQREDTCIICREEMRPWSQTNPPQAQGQPAIPRPAGTVNERQRPKKLPCGHILHLGCLKSWLERQQVCPTCRAPVDQNQSGRTPAVNGVGVPPPGAAPNVPAPLDGPRAPAAAARPQMRMFNIGPLRLGFGQGNLRDIAGGAGAAAAQGQAGQAGQAGPRVYGLELGFPHRQQPRTQAQGEPSGTDAEHYRSELRNIEQAIMADIRSLQVTQQQLQLVNLLQAELARLQLLQAGGPDPLTPLHAQFPPNYTSNTGVHQRPITRSATPTPSTLLERHSVRPGTTPIPSGSTELPPGVSIPEGWTLLPLHREGPPVIPPTFGQASSGETSNPVEGAGVPRNFGQPEGTNVVFSPTIGEPTNNSMSAATPTTRLSEASPHAQPSTATGHSLSTSDDSSNNVLNAPVVPLPAVGARTNGQAGETSSSSAIAPTPEPSSSWSWDDADDIEPKGDVSGTSNRPDKGKARRQSSEEEEEEEEDDDDDDDDDDEDDEDEQEEDKSKKASVEDVSDEED